jgi:hypothetical protein
MWKFDLKEENWSPVPILSSTQPSPRSEFAHAAHLNDFVVYGGKGDTELYNDLYRYNVKRSEWDIVSVKSTSIPAARKAACIAVSDDFLLIYGGETAAGYSNELWKFEFRTLSYTLLRSPRKAPKSAFSKCNIDINSEGYQIFKIYMGETYSQTSISFLYEYNITLDTWFAVEEDYYVENSRTRGAIFMINDSRRK